MPQSQVRPSSPMPGLLCHFVHTHTHKHTHTHTHTHTHIHTQLQSRTTAAHRTALCCSTVCHVIHPCSTPLPPLQPSIPESCALTPNLHPPTSTFAVIGFAGTLILCVCPLASQQLNLCNLQVVRLQSAGPPPITMPFKQSGSFSCVRRPAIQSLCTIRMGPNTSMPPSSLQLKRSGHPFCVRQLATQSLYSPTGT